MIAVAMQLDVVRRQSSSDSKTVPTELKRIRDLLLEEARKLREFTHQMKPVDVNPKNLRAFLMEIIERFQRETGITAQLVCDSSLPALRQQACDVVARIV